MNQIHLKLEAPWTEVKEKLKEINHLLTDEDLDYEPGLEEEMLKRVANKMNRTIEETKGWIESVSYNRGIAY